MRMGEIYAAYCSRPNQVFLNHLLTSRSFCNYAHLDANAIVCYFFFDANNSPQSSLGSLLITSVSGQGANSDSPHRSLSERNQFAQEPDARPGRVCVIAIITSATHGGALGYCGQIKNKASGGLIRRRSADTQTVDTAGWPLANSPRRQRVLRALDTNRPLACTGTMKAPAATFSSCCYTF
jgi:hypothetical protein